MASFETEGIILKHFDLGESDKIITFYTRDKGKVRAVASGARKAKSRISGLVLPFSYNLVTFYKGKSLYRINHIENKYSFSELRENLLKMAYASYIAEISAKTGQEDNENELLFSLILKTFYKIMKAENDSEKLDLINIKFKGKLLEVIGFKPELESCLKCEKEIKPIKDNIFNIAMGGLLCKDCSKDNNQYDFHLNGESLIIMRYLLGENKELPYNLKISQKAYHSINKLIDKFIIYHLDINIKSEKFLHMIKNFG